MHQSADLILMAAGQGLRYGRKKQFMPYGSKTVLDHCIKTFSSLEDISKLIIVYPPDMTEKEVASYIDPCDCLMVKGDKERMLSVINGLLAVRAEYVVVHDAVRPKCSAELIKKVLATAFRKGSAVPCVSPVSTVLYREEDELRYLDRNKVLLVQTPQAYSTDMLLRAYRENSLQGATDSSSIFRAAGNEIEIVEGEHRNIKITFPEDYDQLITEDQI